jgi:hypothetical protein
VYDSTFSPVRLSASALEAFEQSLADGEPAMLPAQEAASAFAFVSPASPVVPPLEKLAPEAAAPWHLLPEPFFTVAPVYASPVKQPPR